MIQRVSQIFSKLGVIYHYQINLRTNERARSNSRSTLKISVKGLGSCKKVIDCIYDQLTCKKEQADLMLAFIAHRKGKFSKNGGHRNAKYDEYEWQLFERLKALKHILVFPQRLQRKASVPITDEGIVRAYTRV